MTTSLNMKSDTYLATFLPDYYQSAITMDRKSAVNMNLLKHSNLLKYFECSCSPFTWSSIGTLYIVFLPKVANINSEAPQNEM